MKRTLLVLLGLIMLYPSIAGNGFREMHKLNLPFKPSEHFYSHTDDFTFFLCSTKEDMLMLDGKSGKILWQANFGTAFANKKINGQYWNKSANVILLFNEDSKKGVAEKMFVDGKTGKLLWKSNKYVSELGEYELAAGFSNYYNEETNGVLLPTNESVDLVDVSTGNVIWSRKLDLSGKVKTFDCYIMEYYNLVEVNRNKEEIFYLTTKEGKEVTDMEPYFNKKKYLEELKHSYMVNIPEKNMYIIMKGETSKVFSSLGLGDMPSFAMKFTAYEDGSNKELWKKEYKISYMWNQVDNSALVKLYAADGKLFIEGSPVFKTTGGLTVLDVNTGEKLWEGGYWTFEDKGKLTTPFPAPDPLVYDGKVYVVNKNKNNVTCYDAQKGSEIWKSESFPDAQKIPSLVGADGVVIMTHGGDAVKIKEFEQKIGAFTKYYWKYVYGFKDKYGIIAYDAKTGNIIWDNKIISKKVKDKFDFIAGSEFIEGKLYVATDLNLFILDPKTGDAITSIPVAKEKMGDIWKMHYFPEQKKIVLNCYDGVIKIDAVTSKIEGSVATSNAPFYPASFKMNYDDLYTDYAIFTSGNSEKMDFKEFASIDLENMKIRGVDEGNLLFYDEPHFSEGGNMFYKADGETLTVYEIN